jgi:hypothetical protein
MSMGFKAAKGLNKIVGVLGGPSLSPAQLAQQAQQQALQQVQQQNPQFTQILQTVQTVAQNVSYAQNSSANGNSNSAPTTSFDLSNIQASLPDFSNIQTISPDVGTTVQEVVVSETVYNAGTGDTTAVVVESTTTS